MNAGRLQRVSDDVNPALDLPEALRRFFEVDAASICVATLHVLAQRGEVDVARVADAIRDLGIDPAKPDPARS